MAGRRHSERDQQLINGIVENAIELGADHPRIAPPPPETVEYVPPAGKTLVARGGAVKALGDGRLGGYLVLYGDREHTDLVGDYFAPDTDFGDHDTSPVLYHHGADPDLGARKLSDGHLRRDRIGVWIETQLALRDEYERAIYALAERGKLGWSSGTAAHLVERVPDGSAKRITRWPLGLDASLTPTPAEPRTAAVPLKSLIAECRQNTTGESGLESPPAHSVVGPVTTSTGVKTMNQETPNAAPAPTPTSPPPAPQPPAATPASQTPAQNDTIKTMEQMLRDLTAQVAELKSAPPERTPGVAEIVAAQRAPAVLPPREDYATEQLNALKAYLRREIGADAWREHTKRMEQHPELKAAADAWRQLVRSSPEAVPHALGRYAEAATKATIVEGTASLGGYLVPTLYSNQLVGSLTEDSIVRRAGAQAFPVAGANSFRVATITRSGSAPIAAELSAAAQTEPTFGEITFTAYAYRAQYIASREQVADSRIPLEQVLLQNAAWQFTQSENAHFGVGTGTGQPQGIANATTAVSAGSTLALLDSDDVIDLYHSLPYQYRANAVWFANDQVIRQIRRLRENGASGNYLWPPGLQTGQPETLLGRPIYALNTLPSSGSTANVLIFCDPRFYWIADFNTGGTEFQILTELYAASGAVGWWFWRRLDGRIMVAEAFRGARLV